MRINIQRHLFWIHREWYDLTFFYYWLIKQNQRCGSGFSNLPPECRSRSELSICKNTALHRRKNEFFSTFRKKIPDVYFVNRWNGAGNLSAPFYNAKGVRRGLGRIADAPYFTAAGSDQHGRTDLKAGFGLKTNPFPPVVECPRHRPLFPVEIADADRRMATALRTRFIFDTFSHSFLHRV